MKMHNLWNAKKKIVTKCNGTECRCLIHEILPNAEAETTKFYEIVHKLIEAPTFRNILLHFATLR